MQNQHPSFRGLWLPLVTPFNNGQLDTGSTVRLIRHTLGQPVDGLIVAATTGEGLTLSDGETAELVSVAAEATGRKIPLFLGLSGSNTAKLETLVRQTADWPIEGFLISCPYYSRPSQQGLHGHFAAIAEATDRPLMLYNIPYRTGVNLGNETALALAEIDNIVGLKDCCQDGAQSFDLLRRRPADFSIMTGEDAQFYNALVHGADGAILASAHIATDKFAAIHQLLLAGDQAGALRQWTAIADLTLLLFAEPSPAAIKYWLWREGLIDSPELRLPMTGISPTLAARIDAAIASH
jgi:4-hydroxy-tetrahydrodipicolinate synthase